MSTLDKKAFRELRLMRSQTITIALVVAAGVAILISMLSAYDSLQHAADKFYRTSRFADVFATVKRAPRSVLADIENIPGVQTVEAHIVMEATLEVPGVKEPVVGRFVSLSDQRADAVNKIHIRRGRMPVSGSLDEVVISQGFADANRLEPGAKMRAIINGRLRHITVVGTALSPEYIYPMRGLLPDNKHFGILWMSEKTLGELLNMAGSWNSLAMLLERGASRPAVLKATDAILYPYGGPGSIERKRHPSDFFLQQEMLQLKTMGWIIPIIFLGVAAFLLHIVIARLINREREQIATLKALGYSNLRVSLHYLMIVAIMSAIGVAIAIPPGIWIGQWYTNLYKMFFALPSLDFVFRPIIPIEAGLTALTAASLGALGALREAFKLAPAEAMRPPAPTLFRRTFLDKTNMPIATKMAVRTFISRPVRSSMSILGLALALGIVVIAFIYADMIDYLMEYQFNVAQHEDATVVFNSNVSRNAVGELLSVPGVLYAEGYRVAPVRLRSGSIVKDVVIYGMPQSSRLKKLLTTEMGYADLPASGLMLNVRIAARLGLRPGDTVSVEFLDGQRRTESVRVSAHVEEMLGAGGYMEVGSLNRLMREDDLISMAAISIDPDQANGLFLRLREMPQVATVETRQTMITVFEELIAQMMTAMSVGMITFACIIAVGVVYNMVMVSLSERAWELASLRVLGFTQAEVFRVLTGEVAVQVLLSLPLGVVIGKYMMEAMMLTISEEMEAFNFPIIITPSSVMLAVATLLTAAFISALLVRRRIGKLDLVAVLKLWE